MLYGTRTPTDILFRQKLERWRRRLDVEVAGHRGPRRRRMARRCRRGAETDRAGRLRSAPHRRDGLRAGGDDALFRQTRCSPRACRLDRIYLSMERNMKCAIGLCGHCQFGRDFICKDGPVMRLRPHRRTSSPCGRSEHGQPSESRGWRSGNSPPATAVSFRCSTARTNCWRWPTRSRSPISPKPRARWRRGRTICRWSRDRSPRRTTRSASTRYGGSRKLW